MLEDQISDAEDEIDDLEEELMGEKGLRRVQRESEPTNRDAPDNSGASLLWLLLCGKRQDQA